MCIFYKAVSFYKFCLNLIGKDEVFHGLLLHIIFQELTSSCGRVVRSVDVSDRTKSLEDQRPLLVGQVSWNPCFSLLSSTIQTERTVLKSGGDFRSLTSLWGPLLECWLTLRLVTWNCAQAWNSLLWTKPTL